MFYYFFSPGIGNVIQERGVGETIYFGLSFLALIISGVGFWFMRKWGVYTLIGWTLINQVYLLAMGRWNIFSLLIPAVLIYIGYKHLSKMN